MKITWIKQTHVAPGTKLSVEVRSSKRRAQLAFTTWSPGSKRTVLARKTLRNGTFSVVVPSAAGAIYELRITVAGRRYGSRITTPTVAQPPAMPTVPAPVATPTPTPLALCDGPALPFAAELQLGSDTVRAGEPLSYALVNTGQRTFSDTLEAFVAREDRRGSVQLAPRGLGGEVKAGERHAHQVVIPADTVPGRYRLSHGVAHSECDVAWNGPMDGPVFTVTL